MIAGDEIDRHRQRPLQHGDEIGVFGDQPVIGQIARNHHRIRALLQRGHPTQGAFGELIGLGDAIRRHPNRANMQVGELNKNH